MICVSGKWCSVTRQLFCGVVLLFALLGSSSSENDINCVILKHCPLALKLVETKRDDPAAIKFLRLTHCGFKGRQPMVWCNMFDKCKTPDNRDGKCVSIRTCSTFIDLIKHSELSDEQVRKSLSDFRCSTIYDPDIKVCCAENEEIKEECGRQSSDNRIYGGVQADINEYPWMALLRYHKTDGLAYGCGGSLITSRFVLTAGHCLDPIIYKTKGLKSIHRIILGEYDTRNKTDCIYNKYGSDCADPVQEIEMKAFIIHPGYMSGYTDNDIGIIKLREKVRYTDFIRPICLPPETMEVTEKDIFMIAGWGKTPKDKMSSVKRKARIEMVDKELCNQYLDDKPLDDSKICAGGTGDGVDACFGDSGGPMMLGRNLNNHYTNFVIGIISHGFGGTCGEKPGVYTFVPYYIDWIKSNLVF
ncbi:hypothetical protein HHI36_012110 [Cryptolaemus montrouzieri]|uniref:CLIP domain-containing serine protease n=1 Tax=Cryptolaemus montrouzieri TaxID=559131 RepID=A0ABD2NE53_9CUCU